MCWSGRLDSIRLRALGQQRATARPAVALAGGTSDLSVPNRTSLAASGGFPRLRFTGKRKHFVGSCENLRRARALLSWRSGSNRTALQSAGGIAMTRLGLLLVSLAVAASP